MSICIWNIDIDNLQYQFQDEKDRFLFSLAFTM